MRNALALLIAISFGVLGSHRATADMLSVPANMAAAAIDRGGGPDVLSIHRVPVPKPNADEVLVAVQDAGVGVWEADMRQHPAAQAHFPLVLGSDGSGTIVAVGSRVKGFKIGDRVYGTNAAFDAEYATVSAANIAKIPRNFGFTQAAILAISGLSALQGIDLLQLRPGMTLLIHGAAGGVGTLATQMAKERGVKVLATASSEEGETLLRELGADDVVNGRTGDIAAAAKRLSPNGVDAVLGLVGGEELEHCIDSVRRDGLGRVAYLYGTHPLPKPRFGITMTLYSFVSGTRELQRLNRVVESGKLRVPVSAEYSLADAALAHQHLEAGHLLGKIVLHVR